MQRIKTRAIHIGNVQIGHQNDVLIQSMTNTVTADIEATCRQIQALQNAGCQLVRLAVTNEIDAKAIREIKRQSGMPLVADIHYDYRLALMAIEHGIDKIRLNPGNIGAADNVRKVVNACKQHHIPIRIGINSGSIEKDLQTDSYVTKEAMIASAKRHVDILEAMEFYDICLSFKASDTGLTIDTYRLASEVFPYPLHLGVTEAGTAFHGSIKSAVALGSLLHDGIGDTIRVSLSDDPVEEIRVAKSILRACGLYKKAINLISCPTCGRTQYDLIALAKRMEIFVETINCDLTVAIMGCAVNGPGEARHADIGIAGGLKEGLLFRKGEIIAKVPEHLMEETLKQEILALVDIKLQEAENSDALQNKDK